ncbi:HNH endonuclease [Aureimonas mangrovi]|uniref:HNH endonuclease n=1 Tax=Aureimonas mangrovi TaxID=2758041 RepID=UPI00163D85E4|nr:HNH endonuclease [Aureimonas mangrovi]
MPVRSPMHRPVGARTKRERDRQHDDRRGSSASRGYGSKWQKARAQFLAEHPLCCRCQDAGTVEPAAVVDHIVPHRGDPALFWSRSNWQALCKPHHDREKQREEKGR